MIIPSTHLMNFLIDLKLVSNSLILTYHCADIAVHMVFWTELPICCMICILIVILNCYYIDLCNLEFYSKPVLSCRYAFIYYTKLDYFHILWNMFLYGSMEMMMINK
jgi:hypothetical protein